MEFLQTKADFSVAFTSGYRYSPTFGSDVFTNLFIDLSSTVYIAGFDKKSNCLRCVKKQV
jgi:hypothetical protein